MFEMKDRREIEQLNRDELIARILDLSALVEQLRDENRTLRAKIEELERGAHRSAAPFSNGTPKADPKPPGRKKGEGPFTYRRPPLPIELTEHPIDVPVDRTECPACGGALVEVRVDLAYVTDLPPVPRPSIRQYRVSVCECRTCGKQVRGRHPDVAPDQFGATAHRLGTRLKATAHTLYYGLGIPQRKVPEVLHLLSGVEVTQGALSQDAMRQAEGPVGTAYVTLREGVKESPSVHTDDTSWQYDGKPAFLMVFETPTAVVYQIRPQHRNEEVREVVPATYTGVMTCDGGKSYDAIELRDVKQQKCLRHIDGLFEEALKDDPGNGFAATLKGHLDAAHELWRQFRAGAIDRERYDRDGVRLYGVVTTALIGERTRLHFLDPEGATDRDRTNRRLAEGIGEHHDRGNLLRFVGDPSIEPTNNRAERALRPAVIARKVSHCSRNERGATAFSAFVSVIRTATKAGASAVETLSHLFAPSSPSRASP